MSNTQELIKTWKLAKLSLPEQDEIKLFSELWSQGHRSLELHGRMLELCLDVPQKAAELITAYYQVGEDEMVADFLVHHLAPYVRYLPDERELNIPEQNAWRILQQTTSAELSRLTAHHLNSLPITSDCWKEQVTGQTREHFELREFAA